MRNQAQRQEEPRHVGVRPGQAARTLRTCFRRAHLPAAALLLSGVLVAGCTGSPSSPATKSPAGPVRSAAVSSCLAPPAFSCYAPHQFRVAYGIQPLLDNGIDGRGETVTVLAPPPLSSALAPSPDVPAAQSSSAAAAPPPGASPPTTDIRQDLKAFDRVFRLPAARIQVVTTLAGAASPWQAAAEEAQDLEVVHAVAPAATLRVVLLPASVLDNAAHAIHAILRGAAAHHVTVAASSGDNGAVSASYGGSPVKEVSLPASDPLALAAGGTTLTANPVTGAYVRETTWNGATGSFSVTPGASGGGFSHQYPRPAYQDGVPGISTMRGVPDVAGEAGDQGGIPIVLAGGSQSAINSAPGTSASTALWAGLIALADQAAHHDLGFVNPALYRIARSSSYHQAFHDITTGDNLTLGPVNYTYHAGPGWDPVTGWGSPNARVLIPLLARS